ncbi:MAG: iron ABC transporter permease [Chloroflexota bacterium]|nr:iron ABC transporter permease [Chloroflexota bacterium]
MRAATAVTQRSIAGGPSLSRSGLVLGGGTLLLLVVGAVAIALGSTTISLGDTLGILGHRLLGIGSGVAWAPTSEQIIMEIRLPRVLTAMLVGGGLGMAGAAFQALLRNPLADPYIIGTASGASLGAVLALMLPLLAPGLALGAGSAWLGIGLVQALAFIGGLATVLLVYAVSRSARGGAVTLLLTGYAVSSILAAGVALLMYLSGNRLGAIFSWLMGSLDAGAWPKLALATPLVAVSLILLMSRWRRLNVFLLGDAQAAHLGVDVARERLLLTMLASLATSAVVAVAGTIGFVGLVVPHVLRLAAGPDHRLLLPASLLYGAALLTLADLGARLAGGIPVGIVTALVGAPFFIWLLVRSRRLEGVG